MAAQGNPGDLGGTIFTPALEKVTQSGSSVVLTTLRLEGTYDSNLVSSQFGQLASGYTTDEGEAQYSLQRANDNLLLTYIGGERFYPQYSSLNSATQDGRLQWKHSFSKRSNFTLTGRFARLPEGAFQESNPGQVFTLLGTSPISATFLQQRVEIVDGAGSWEQGLTRHTWLIVGGNYDSTKRFGSGLVDTKEQNAYAGLYYWPSGRQSVGLVYAHQWIQFSQGLGTSQVDNALLSYSRIFSKDISVSVFGGPAVVVQRPGTAGPSTNVLGLPTGVLSTLAPREQGLVGGGTVNMQFGRNKIRGEYTRLITGGSGFTTTVLRQTGDLTASRNITPRLELALGLSYTGNLLVGAANTQFRIYYIEPAVHYQLTSRLKIVLRGSGGRVTGLSQIGTITRKKATAELEYSFREIPIRW